MWLPSRKLRLPQRITVDLRPQLRSAQFRSDRAVLSFRTGTSLPAILCRRRTGGVTGRSARCSPHSAGDRSRARVTLTSDIEAVAPKPVDQRGSCTPIRGAVPMPIDAGSPESARHTVDAAPRLGHWFCISPEFRLNLQKRQGCAGPPQKVSDNAIMPKVSLLKSVGVRN